jgi:hypothetical protein
MRRDMSSTALNCGVVVNRLPLCRQNDTVLEALGEPDKIALGELTVPVGG